MLNWLGDLTSATAVAWRHAGGLKDPVFLHTSGDFWSFSSAFLRTSGDFSPFSSGFLANFR